jgi:thiol-disulfide isomerase/thioredoxin
MQSPRQPFLRHAAALAVGALALVACGGGDDDGATAPPPPGTAPGAASADGDNATSGSDVASDPTELAALLAEAFATSTPLDSAVQFDGASLAGRDAVVWFWAPWCTICRAEAPEVAEIAERYGADIELVGVAGRGELDAMREFVDDTGTGSITHLADLDGDVWSAFGVYGQPAFAFIDDSGDVEVFIGRMGGDALADRIDELIAT